jgi:hypothetical protein
MQFLTLFSRHPDKAETPAPADLREAEFEMIRGLNLGAQRNGPIFARGSGPSRCA